MGGGGGVSSDLEVADQAGFLEDDGGLGNMMFIPRLLSTRERRSQLSPGRGERILGRLLCRLPFQAPPEARLQRIRQGCIRH